MTIDYSPARLLLIIAYIGFISLGLPDTIIGVAWPSVRDTFSLQQSAMALILFGGDAATSCRVSSPAGCSILSASECF
jgi:hypothetical protein